MKAPLVNVVPAPSVTLPPMVNPTTPVALAVPASRRFPVIDVVATSKVLTPLVESVKLLYGEKFFIVWAAPLYSTVPEPGVREPPVLDGAVNKTPATFKSPVPVNVMLALGFTLVVVMFPVTVTVPLFMVS